MSNVPDQINEQLPGKPTPFAILHRVALTLIGSYAFTWGFTAFGMAVLAGLGVDFHEAETAMLMIAFLLIVPLFLWSFAVHSLARVWVVLGGGAFLFTATALGLQHVVLF